MSAQNRTNTTALHILILPQLTCTGTQARTTTLWRLRKHQSDRKAEKAYQARKLKSQIRKKVEEGRKGEEGGQHRGRRDSIYWKLNSKAVITFYPHKISHVLFTDRATEGQKNQSWQSREEQSSVPNQGAHTGQTWGWVFSEIQAQAHSPQQSSQETLKPIL